MTITDQFLAMPWKLLPIALGLLQVVASLPAGELQDLMMVDDTMSVGSYIRAVRAAAPEDYHKSYEKEGEGEIGYSRKKSGGGKKGYQFFDSFHKKAGDHFEFEKQDAYGQDDKGQAGAHSHRHEQREKYRANPKRADAEEIEKNENDEIFKNKDHEELKEGGADDGNGGIESYGHDPADYVLPEKYTYGAGDEYNY